MLTTATAIFISHTNPVGGVSRFAYDFNHGLIDIRNALGAQVARNDYDASGRLIAITDANGKQITFSHNDGGQRGSDHRPGSEANSA